jgi:hypothetical protein
MLELLAASTGTGIVSSWFHLYKFENYMLQVTNDRCVTGWLRRLTAKPRLTQSRRRIHQPIDYFKYGSAVPALLDQHWPLASSNVAATPGLCELILRASSDKL